MASSVSVSNLADWLVEWGAIGAIDGLAADNDAISYEALGDDPELTTSGDGLASCLSADNDRRYDITVKLNCGADDTYCRLMESWLGNKATSDYLTATNTRTGESLSFDCASIKRMPLRGAGFRAGSNTLDVVFQGVLDNFNKGNQNGQVI